MALSCKELLDMVHLLEVFELESNDIINKLYYNIKKEKGKYEWDIIYTFKYYDFLFDQPSDTFPECMCPLCFTQNENQKKKNIVIMKRLVYVMEMMKTMTDRSVMKQFSKFVCSQEGDYIRKKINYYYRYLDKNDTDSFRKIWESRNDDYQQLFGIPWVLASRGIPLEEYLKRKELFLDDAIAGHPKASDGWFAESTRDMIEMGALDYSSSSTSSVFGDIE